MKKRLPQGPIILITTAHEISEANAQPSPLLKHYDLPNMLAIFRKKISKDIGVDKLEKSILQPEQPLENDVPKLQVILQKKVDLDEKMKELVRLYHDVHYYSKEVILQTMAQILFAKKQWFIDHPNEASKLFPNQSFDEKFFDNRRNFLCLFSKKNSL